MGVFNALGVPEGEQIQHKMLTSAIEKAQEKIEANNFGIRKIFSSMTRWTMTRERLSTASV